MNENEFDLAARAWLDDGPTRMSDRALLSALEEIHTTRQRRAVWSAWRTTPVSRFAPMAAAAVLGVAVGLLAANVVPRQPDGSGIGSLPTPSPTDAPTPSPSPSASEAGALDVPALTQTFVSPRNGFSIKHPNRVAITPATQLLGFNDEQVDDGFDVIETGLSAVFKGASTGIPDMLNGFVAGSDGVSIDEWVDEHISAGGCGGPRSQQAETTIDGQLGRIAECPNEIEATVFAGRRVYQFTLLHDRSDARAVFDAFAATIDLNPETAVDVPNLTTTFVSPTYGFSFGYLDRGEGTLMPAREVWDPVNQPPIDDLDSSGAQYLEQFDVVETGLAAVFMSASTEIPDGASTDEWVDAAVVKYLPAGCYVPRSEQAPITIDGQSGTISEDCPNKVVATVVADGRLYLFILGHDRSDARAFFDAWAGTIELRPEELGQSAAVPYSFLDGEVTFAAAPPWDVTTLDPTFTILGRSEGGWASQFTMFAVVADPRTGTGCDDVGPVPADAEALVRSIRTNPDLESTDPVAVSVGGIDALLMDVLAPGQVEVGDCLPMVLEELWLGPDERMRLHLLDLPDGMSSRIVAIAIVAHDSLFELVSEAATPVLDTVEFHTP